jgi:hypothetical protein
MGTSIVTQQILLNTQGLSPVMLPSQDITYPQTCFKQTIPPVRMPHSAITIARLVTVNKIITGYCLKQVNLINTPVGEMWSRWTLKLFIYMLTIPLWIDKELLFLFHRQNLSGADKIKIQPFFSVVCEANITRSEHLLQKLNSLSFTPYGSWL